ncbi:MAG: NFACT RNA binding domain-containing protein [Clostridia bacterium]|nr:NFACT RNA binding domain-containing protein [Clostridia bacterium]
MALDGIYLRHLKAEIENNLIGGRVDKIYQPSRDELVFVMRTREANYKLLLSARPDTARINFTSTKPENPKTPPMLCMLMRKRLQSAKLIEVEQKGLERAVTFKFDAVNELGDHVVLSLVCEIMGKYSNIIFVNEEGKIIDALRRVDAEMSTERLIFPGLLYRDPPAQDKLCILDVEVNDVIRKIQALPKAMTLSKALMATLQGISPIISREIEAIVGRGSEVITTEMSDADLGRLMFALRDLKDRAINTDGTPVSVIDPKLKKPKDFAFMNITQYGSAMNIRRNVSGSPTAFSDLLDSFYEERDAAERMRTKSADLLKLLSNREERLSRKINNQKAELEETAKREEYRIKADLINSNIYAIPKSASSVELMNYYEPDCPMVTIKLNPAWSASQNAQKYYKDYRKAKTAEVKLKEQIELSEQELEYLESVFYSLAEAKSEQELNEIRAELASQGYVKNTQNKKNNKPESIGKPLRFEVSDGFTVLVGRNNRQNDKLTMKDSSNNDIWFHTKNIPGSHTVLVTDGRTPTDKAMEDAAVLAAIHSRAKESSQIPVDYTQIRNVHKPQGAKPGMVNYFNYKTVYVNPEDFKED